MQRTKRTLTTSIKASHCIENKKQEEHQLKQAGSIYIQKKLFLAKEASATYQTKSQVSQ